MIGPENAEAWLAAGTPLSAVGRALDVLGAALCVFDAADRTVLWNQTYLRFFSNGQVHDGEPYAEALRRLYRGSLPLAELERTEQHVAASIARHRSDGLPFSFDYAGRRLTGTSVPLPSGGRMRIWAPRHAAVPATPGPGVPPLPDALFEAAAGAAVVDKARRLCAVNAGFLRLYDLPCTSDAIGLTFAEVVARAWAPYSAAARLPAQTSQPGTFEVELPGGRWRRVAQHGQGGTHSSHTDITVAKQQQQALQDAYARLEALSVTDSLTGIPNRRRFDEALQHEVSVSARTGAPLSLLLLDVDRFKQVNDDHGHAAGDACLQRLAGLMRRAVRAGDLPARLGGDEFALILPGAGYTDAASLADLLRQNIAADPGRPPISASIGVATLDGTAGYCAGPSLVAAADRALYAAKQAGRNRVCGPA